MRTIKLVLRNGKVIFKELPESYTEEYICEMYNENTRIKYYDGESNAHHSYVKEIHF